MPAAPCHLSPGAWRRAWHGGGAQGLGAQGLGAQVVSADRTARGWLLRGQPARPGLLPAAWITGKGAMHSHRRLVPFSPGYSWKLRPRDRERLAKARVVLELPLQTPLLWGSGRGGRAEGRSATRV